MLYSSLVTLGEMSVAVVLATEEAVGHHNDHYSYIRMDTCIYLHVVHTIWYKIMPIMLWSNAPKFFPLCSKI